MSALSGTRAQETPGRDASALLQTYLLCDLADSATLVAQLGDVRAAELFRRHDRFARALAHQFGGREIDRANGFLLMFDRPVEAVGFALAYQRGVRKLADADGAFTLRARVGIHAGDVVVGDNTRDNTATGEKRSEAEDLARQTTSCLMRLARPGQILLSGVAAELARHSQHEFADLTATALWRTHRRYRFGALPDSVAVFEAGEKSIAPLKPPPGSTDAHRVLPFWRRPRAVAVEVLVVVALAALSLWYLLRPEAAIAFAQRDWIVVGTFRNLTNDSSFDDSLQAALRIGLEQSRYVNVLSDLKTRNTVNLMQRDPEHTDVDRAIGSQVAIRNGARALVLPTVAQIDGRVRVTAEVVDPHTQMTVWSESADGVGQGSVLRSLDAVNQKLRVRLGEALATVSSESRPLEKVTTRSLEALRAYSLAEHSYNANSLKDSIALYRLAIKLDPEFALAHIGLASALVVADQRTDAIAELDSVLTKRDRLPPREALYAEAWKLSLMDSQRAAIDKWHMTAQLYPDFFAAHGLYAFFGWEFANRFDDEVVAAAKAAASPKNPSAAISLLLLGMLELGNERPDAAIRTFDAAEKGGLDWHFDYALPHAAKRDFATADAILKRGTSNGVPGSDIDADILRIAVAFDEGSFDAGRTQIETSRGIAREAAGGYVRIFDVIDLSLSAALELRVDSRIAALNAHVAQLQRDLAKATDGERDDLRFQLAFAAYVAARMNDATLARAALADVTKDSTKDFPVIGRMAAVASSQAALADGHPVEAIRTLKPMLDGTELFVTHVVLMNAYAAHDELALALEQAKWIAEHRGRAYGEYNSRQMLTPLNVAESNLALLRAAELERARGNATAALASLDAFEKAWPGTGAIETLAKRVRSLRKDP